MLKDSAFSSLSYCVVTVLWQCYRFGDYECSYLERNAVMSGRISLKIYTLEDILQ